MQAKLDLQRLINNELFEARELRLTNLGLTEIPEQVFLLANSLELLDLSGNNLSHIPDKITALKKLKIAFFSFNDFEIFPEILGQLPQLEMVAFRSNRIRLIPDNAFPKRLRWLILTENEIEILPPSIGAMFRLKKLMLAGNRLKNLPIELKECRNLELLRISANELDKLPEWIYEMPRLAWLAFSGSKFNASLNEPENINYYDYANFEIQQILGEGASGVIHKAIYFPTNEQVALKIFKNKITSDGFPDSEMHTCIKVNNHPNLIKIKGAIAQHPEFKMGLVMDLLHENYKNLGNPPSFDTCTRDVFTKKTSFSLIEIVKVVYQTAQVSYFLHKNNCLHGDLYAHNILINEKKHIFLSDFGAATLYADNDKEIEKIEVRAWGCLLEDLILHCSSTNSLSNNTQKKLINLINKCLTETVSNRPTFEAILEELNTNFDIKSISL